MNNPFTLEGKTILITGASSGIGKEISRQVANMGGSVVALGRNSERLLTLIDSLPNGGHEYYPGDLNDSSYRGEVINKIGKLDGVVNCAGIMKLSPLKFLEDELISEVVNINYVSPLKLIRDLFKSKCIAKGGSIIFITSINGGVVGSKANSLYGSTKAALTGLSRALAIDYGHFQVRFNCIAPGMIETEGIDEVINSVSKESIEEDKKKYPMKRYGQPTDVAYSAIYLLSDASKWITGTTLVVDGGYTAQ